MPHFRALFGIWALLIPSYRLAGPYIAGNGWDKDAMTSTRHTAKYKEWGEKLEQAGHGAYNAQQVSDLPHVMSH